MGLPTVSEMSGTRAYSIFIAILFFSAIQAHPLVSSKVFAATGQNEPKWRPFNTVASNPVIMHGKGYPQDEDSVNLPDLKDFVANLKAALKNEISALIDMQDDQGWPVHYISQKRRYLPQQLLR